MLHVERLLRELRAIVNVRGVYRPVVASMDAEVRGVRYSRARCVVWWSIDDSGYLTRKERQASEVDCRSGMEEEGQSWRRANVICGPALYTFQKNSCNFRLPRFRIGLSAAIRLYSCLRCPHISLNFARSHA